MYLRSTILLGICALVGTLHTEGGEPAKKGSSKDVAQYWGKVIPAAPLIEAGKVKASADALALVGDKGEIFIVAKEGADMFYKDKRLLQRPMRITGKIAPGTNQLQVVAVHSVIKGKLHDVYYWCEECKLRYPEPGICICCGARTELIEEPLK